MSDKPLTLVRVDYSRTVGAPGSFSPTRIGGSVEVSVAKNADWLAAWGDAYGRLRAEVDRMAAQVSVEPSSGSSAPAPEEATPVTMTEEVSQPSVIFGPDSPVSFDGCRVMFDPNTLDEDKKRKRRAQVRMRIGNKEQIPLGTPQGYVNAKVYVDDASPELVATMRNLRKGDIVDVHGYFEEPWTKTKDDGSSVLEYDLVVGSISRA